ncbi:MAG: insulinase family protein [Vampirovibrio sp.]|nr:insulinase family protein [Vampirovibrio sp.]
MAAGYTPAYMPSVPITSANATFLQPGNYLPAPSVLVPPNAFMPRANTSPIGPVVKSRVMNGAAAHLQQVQGQKVSQISVILPVGPLFPSVQSLVPGLLTNGSAATKALVTQAAADGIDITAIPGGEKIILSLSSPIGKETAMIQTAMQLLTRPVVDPVTFNTLKQDQIEAFRKLLDDPKVPVFDALGKQLYGMQHPYGISVPDLYADLVKQDAKTLMDVYQFALGKPKEASVLFVSPLPVAQQQALLDQGIQSARWFANPYHQGPFPATPRVQKRQGKIPPVLIPSNKVQRAHIVRAWQAPTVESVDYPAFVLITQLLGGMTGGWFKELRTRQGMVYSTQQGYNLQKNGADYNVSAEVNFDKVGPALQSMDRVIQELISQPVDLQTLEKVKLKYMREVRTQTQSSEGIAAVNLDRLTDDHMPLHPNDLIARMMAVTPQDIQRVAATVFGPQSGFEITGVSAPAGVLQQWFGSTRRV